MFSALCSHEAGRSVQCRIRESAKEAGSTSSIVLAVVDSVMDAGGGRFREECEVAATTAAAVGGLQGEGSARRGLGLACKARNQDFLATRQDRSSWK